MTHIRGLALVLALACRPEPQPQAVAEAHSTQDSSFPSVMSLALAETLPGGTILIRDGADSSLHDKDWSRHDSLVGAFMKLGWRRGGSSVGDAATLPAEIKLGGTTAGSLRTILGGPSEESSAADTLLLQYGSPFIGPDESVTFLFVDDTLRQLRWDLYSG
jgi:hypothetical protein